MRKEFPSDNKARLSLVSCTVPVESGNEAAGAVVKLDTPELSEATVGRLAVGTLPVEAIRRAPYLAFMHFDLAKNGRVIDYKARLNPIREQLQPRFPGVTQIDDILMVSYFVEQDDEPTQQLASLVAGEIATALTLDCRAILDVHIVDVYAETAEVDLPRPHLTLVE